MIGSGIVLKYLANTNLVSVGIAGTPSASLANLRDAKEPSPNLGQSDASTYGSPTVGANVPIIQYGNGRVDLGKVSLEILYDKADWTTITGALTLGAMYDFDQINPDGGTCKYNCTFDGWGGANPMGEQMTRTMSVRLNSMPAIANS